MFTPALWVTSEVTHDKFVVLTPPKSGTHLLSKAIKLITGRKVHQISRKINSTDRIIKLLNLIERNNKFFSNHHVSNNLIQILIDNDYKIVTILRDPRDQLISRINWCLEGNYPPIDIGDMTREEQISEFTTGSIFGFQAFEHAFDGQYKYQLISSLDNETLYITTFERLVGPEGGGQIEDQISEIQNIAGHISIDLSEQEALGLARQLFGNTPTFRSAQIGRWKSQFTERNKEEYKIRYGQILVDWGYENDFNW